MLFLLYPTNKKPQILRCAQDAKGKTRMDKEKKPVAGDADPPNGGQQDNSVGAS